MTHQNLNIYKLFGDMNIVFRKENNSATFWRVKKKRVIKNYFIIIITTVTLFEGLFIFYVQNYYYDSVRQNLKNQVEYTSSVYNTSINNIENTTFDEK